MLEDNGKTSITIKAKHINQEFYNQLIYCSAKKQTNKQKAQPQINKIPGSTMPMNSYRKYKNKKLLDVFSTKIHQNLKPENR